MEPSLAELDNLLQGVIALAERRLIGEISEARREQYGLILKNFLDLRGSLREGKLTGIGEGYGFGAGRALSEWGMQEGDEEVWRAVDAAEDFFRYGSSPRPET
jgi:hypothetical protein